MMRKTWPYLIGLLLAGGIATAAAAETQMEKALANGAKRISSDEIVARLAGKTVTFELAATGDRFLVYYDGENGTLLRKVGGDEETEGFYAVDLADHICVGSRGAEAIRLRCMNVLLIDGLMHKFELDGSLRGKVIEEAEGNIM